MLLHKTHTEMCSNITHNKQSTLQQVNRLQCELAVTLPVQPGVFLEAAGRSVVYSRVWGGWLSYGRNVSIHPPLTHEDD